MIKCPVRTHRPIFFPFPSKYKAASGISGAALVFYKRPLAEPVGRKAESTGKKVFFLPLFQVVPILLTPETLPLHQTSLRHLCDLLEGSETRLYVVGGAGSLYVDEGHTIRLMDTPDFPDAFKPLATEMGKALDALRTRKTIHWTYLSPAADFRADGARSGRYRIGGEELLLNADGQSVISYADYAAAMVDLIEQGGHDRERVSAAAL